MDGLPIPGGAPAAPRPPVVGQGAPPGQPPFGSSPVTQPTPNRGLQASALAQVQWAVRLLETALPQIGVETEPGKDIMRALTALSKHIPPGSTAPGVENNALHQLMMKARQDQPMISAIRATQPAGMPAGGMPGAPPPPAM